MDSYRIYPPYFSVFIPTEKLILADKYATAQEQRIIFLRKH
jgi:hypothetical protein